MGGDDQDEDTDVRTLPGQIPVNWGFNPQHHVDGAGVLLDPDEDTDVRPQTPWLPPERALRLVTPAPVEPRTAAAPSSPTRGYRIAVSAVVVLSLLALLTSLVALLLSLR